MEVERSSICNCVVNFLLEENYLLTAFELLHELLDDGRHDQAIRLQHYFADPTRFPPNQISRLNSLSTADPQTLVELKNEAQHKLAITDYELRLANEDLAKLKSQFNHSQDVPQSNGDDSEQQIQEQKGNDNHDDDNNNNNNEASLSCSALGPLKETERRDLNCAVKEYLLMAGYRLTAMTFYEEVTDQDLDTWQKTRTLTPNALRHYYYYHFLSSTSEAAKENIAKVRENEALLGANEKLKKEKERLLKDKDLADGQIGELTKSLEALKKDLKDKEHLAQVLRQSLESQRKELQANRVEISKLQMHIERSGAGANVVGDDVGKFQPESLEKYKEEIEKLKKEIEWLKEKNIRGSGRGGGSENENQQIDDNVIEIHEDQGAISYPVDAASKVVLNEDIQPTAFQSLDKYADKHEDALDALFDPTNTNSAFENTENVSEQNVGKQEEDSRLNAKSDSATNEALSQKMGYRTIQILADALPKIVPYVLINHREELLPLMMCAIEYHPDGRTRDSLTHTLFNLIKRPDEIQRRIIMDACVSLAKNVGEMRTETELLPQCWEQINHMYEERRLLVAQSCGELAECVRPEIRDSLILSIVQQLIEDSATIVREAAAHNLAMLLPLFQNMDKYIKVEELMFQLICDPSGVVVETTLKVLVTAVIKWGNQLDHVLRVLLSHLLSSAQHCPPLSVIEGCVESHLHALGERERWNIDVLLRMLIELLPLVHQKAIETCPFSSTEESSQNMFSTTLLEMYSRGRVEWEAFEWMHVECFPKLIQLACLLPRTEDNLRNRISKFLLSVSERFGDSYRTCIMLPVFLTAVGDDAHLTYFPSAIHSRIKGLRPRSVFAEKLSALCVLPLLLAGILGAPGKRKKLEEYLRKLLLEDNSKDNLPTKHTLEIINAFRFICIYEENHAMIFNILWEMVVSSDMNMKISAAKLLKAIVPYIDAKVASTHILPALVTLGSDQNLNVKCASIEAFGAVAQRFKNEMIVDKIRVQMGAFLEDGSHEATIAVIRALVIAVPHTTERLRDYLLSKISQLTAMPTAASSDLTRRRERANAFCEAIRALDATELPANSVRDMLLPATENLLKDLDALDPAHKEALEIIMKERTGASYGGASKSMGSHLGLASSLSVSNFFGGDGGLRGKKESTEVQTEKPVSPKAAMSQPQAEDTRLRRIMMGHFSEILRTKGKPQEDPHNQ